MDRRGPIEAALTTDLRGQPYNFSLWDIHTSTQIVTFKGIKGNPVSKSLCLIDNNLFITAVDNVLHIWSIHNRKCQDQRLFLPDRPSTLCISPCTNFLAVGIGETIYVWQLCSGNLLAHVQRHYQTVSVLKYNIDGTYLISGGDDGLVLVWPHADLISASHHLGALNQGRIRRDIGVNEPKFSWQHHSAQVTDIQISCGGLCISASIDKTINIYCCAKGRRLHCLSFPSPIWSVVMNKNETKILAGCQDGNIYETLVSSISLSLNNLNSIEFSDRKPVFQGHKGKVIALAISTDGTRLVSASSDSTCKVWDTHLRKMLLDVKHQAPLANLNILLVPESLSLSSMKDSQKESTTTLKPLKRSLYKPPREITIQISDLFDESSSPILNIKNENDTWVSPELNESSNRVSRSFGMILRNSYTEHQDQNNAQSKDQMLLNLKQKICDLYRLSAEKIFQDAAHCALDSYRLIVDETLVGETRPLKRSLSSPSKSKRIKN